MFARVILRIVLATILVAVLIGAGVYVYNLGVSQGLAFQGLTSPSEGGTAQHPYYPPFYHPFGFGFFPFGWIFGFFIVLFLVGGLMRVIFGGWRRHGFGHWGGMHWRGMHEHDSQQVPPFVEEWHRRMHGEPEKPTKEH